MEKHFSFFHKTYNYPCFGKDIQLGFKITYNKSILLF